MVLNKFVPVFAERGGGLSRGSSKIYDCMNIHKENMIIYKIQMLKHEGQEKCLKTKGRELY